MIFVCIFPSMVTFWLSKLCWWFYASFFGSCESFSTNLWDEPRTMHGMFCAFLLIIQKNPCIFYFSAFLPIKINQLSRKIWPTIHESYGILTVKWPPYLYWWCMSVTSRVLGIRKCFSLAGVHGCKTWDFWRTELDDQPPRNNARKAYPLISVSYKALLRESNG